jgi:hypothetical protein
MEGQISSSRPRGSMFALCGSARQFSASSVWEAMRPVPGDLSSAFSADIERIASSYHDTNDPSERAEKHRNSNISRE